MIMSKRLIFGFLMLLSTALYAQTEENLPWPLGMQARLDSMMRDPLLDYTQVGVMVWDLTDDRPLFASEHKLLLRPASTMKLLTAITALDYLGGDYQFTTSLYYKGEQTGRTLQGNLYCVGGMDPAFSREDLASFAEALQKQGIDTISGNILADISMKDTLKWGEGWCWDDKNPTLSPLLVDRKANFTAQLVSALKEKGIVLRDITLGQGCLPDEAVLVCERKHSIDYILQRMMKDSDNLYAEAMYYQIAARESGKKSGKALHAQRQQKALMERAGLNSSLYRLADGSGLSLYNYLSAECEVRILRYVWQHKTIYKHLLPSLPIAGEDGTLKKRMKDTPAAGNIQAKTGTVTGVSALAGYCSAPNGHRLCFAIINQGIQQASDGRDYQDRICSILCE